MKLQIISLYTKEFCDLDIDDVLPFYQCSFERLNEGHVYECGNGYNAKVQRLLTESLESSCGNYVPDYYYDLRNREDFSCPAPQYMLLDFMGWNRVKPISFLVRSQIDTWLALEHFSLCSCENETAAFTIYEKCNGKGTVISFLVVNSSKKFEQKDLELSKSIEV